MLKNVRQNFIVCLELFARIFLIVGFISMMLLILIADNLNAESLIKNIILISFILIGLSFITEFTMIFLMKPTEHIDTIYDFNFYGLKSNRCVIITDIKKEII